MNHIECIFEKSFMLRERNDPRFTVAWDMDSTLFDDLGGKKRPGLIQALERMRARNIKLVIWTNSEGQRARRLVDFHKVAPYFHALITRESYELRVIKEEKPAFYEKIAAAFPKEVAFQQKYASGKNAGQLGYDVLIDDNPEVRAEAAFWGGAYHVEVCERFTGKGLTQPSQIDLITDRVLKMTKPSFWRRLGLMR